MPYRPALPFLEFRPEFWMALAVSLLSQKMNRILLSVPHMGGNEQTYVRQAFTTNWLSTVGPNIVALENAFAGRVGLPAVALSSGTAGLHLALRLAGVERGDEGFCSPLTFVPAANPILYQAAAAVFLDSDRATWNLHPEFPSTPLQHP